ncbi:CDP-glycerol glycerophosphotransferase family protein [Methanoculleus methanifontis]|nr:CDP-glycerol glycerophosphotransferase family protein [Methanoculleus sp. FWC-SCC3]
MWPKEDNLLVFSGQAGQKLSGNSKYLFQKFIEHYSDEFQTVWITRNQSLVESKYSERSKNCRAVYQYSLDGILTLLRARVIFYVMGGADIPFVAFSQKTITIQLWHGVPIKRIGVTQKLESNKRFSFARFLETPQFTYWISSSAIDRNSTALCSGLPIDRVVITGYPRNDYLVEQKKAPSSEILVRFPYLQKKIILYAPTWRERAKTRFFPFDDFCLGEIKAFLETNDAYLLLRSHRMDDISARVEKNSDGPLTGDRVIAATSDVFEDVQELLPFVDILISDYSSIWVDYLLLDRPLIFVPYDLESYENDRGLLYDYYQITPGPKISTNKELIEAMQEYIHNPEKDSEKRACIREIFHKYEDGLSYMRIYEIIKRCK